MAQRKRQSSQSGSGIWIALVVLLMVLMGIYMLKDNGANSFFSMGHKEALVQIDTSGKDADYRPVSEQVQKKVFQQLRNQNAKVEELQKEERQDCRESTGGNILWNVQTFAYTPSEESDLTKIAEKIKIDGAKVNIAEAGKIEFEGRSLSQYTVFLEVELDQRVLTMIVGRIYVLPMMDEKETNNTKELLKSQEKKQIAIDKAVLSGKKNARIAIVIDDFGYSYDVIGKFNQLPIPLTYAVLPYHQFSTAAANEGFQAGKHIILHLPMESLSDVGAEKITIRTWMSTEEVQSITRKAIAAVPHLVGVNNHQGSKATADKLIMQDVMNVLKEKQLFFVDSHTNSQSVAMSTARSFGVPTGINELFLDNEDTIAAIENKLAESGRMALQSPGGFVIVIGHARHTTATALEHMIPKLQAQGIEFVFVKSVLY